MEKIQQEFEVWAIEHHFSTTKKQDGVSYAHDSTMCAFEGWKASRSALCVELNNVVFSRDKNGEGGLMLPERVFKAMDDARVSYK